MAPAIMNSNNRIDNIIVLVKQMTVRQQEELERQLLRFSLMRKARRLKASVISNDFSIQEIVEEVNNVRDEE